MSEGDTIVALSSGTLPSGVAVIRLSGPKVQELLLAMVGQVPPPRLMKLLPIGIDEVIDRGLVVFFPGPHSFTGEDCAELQVHGSPAGVRASLRKLVDFPNVRLAEAGEFTRRAFENGKLDLVEIEGLGDLLEAETENQRKQAMARFEGGLTKRINQWREQLLDLRAELEARLDFSDEGDVSDDLPVAFGQQLSALQIELCGAHSSVTQGRITREGLRVALAGAPNAGKSSLLNALAQSDIAIVTDEAGTTRDVREVPIDIGGRLVVLVDLAGLRETASKAEAEGVRRAYEQIAKADLVLWLKAPDVIDVDIFDANGAPVWLVRTKSDLGIIEGSEISVSVTTGDGIANLLSRIGQFVDANTGHGEPMLLSRERDREALERALSALDLTAENLHIPEVAADGLRQASHALERLVGRLDAEHVLGRLFSSFCIGK